MVDKHIIGQHEKQSFPIIKDFFYTVWKKHLTRKQLSLISSLKKKNKNNIITKN